MNSKKILLTLFTYLLTFSLTSFSQETADFFKLNCSSCHTIGGGRLTGPDLKNVTERKDKAWLIKFIQDPRASIDAGDAYAQQLVQEARGAIMPTLPTVTKARAEALMNLIEAESKLPKSQFQGVQISDRPFTPADVQRGRDLFLGNTRLKNGGAPCISCHNVNGIGGLGGGLLGPDLTTVFERYDGRKTLSTWLSAPATPTMQATFKETPIDADEILPLVAFFQSTNQMAGGDNSTARINFLLLGLGGTVVLLALFDVIWNKRFRAVRRPLYNMVKEKILKGKDA